MADKPLNDAELQTLRATFGKYFQRFQQQLSMLDSSKSSFSLADSGGVETARLVAGQEFAQLTTALNTGAIGGTRLTDAAFKSQVTRLANALKSYGQALEAWNARSPSATLGSLAEGALGLATEVLGVVTAPARFIKNVLIWGTVGVAAVFLLPPLLRTFSAYKRGGSRAAADAAADSLERGQQNVTSAGRKAAELTARGAAAYASGGTSEVARKAAQSVSGFRRRARRRSR
jgi:hypothetical protein